MQGLFTKFSDARRPISGLRPLLGPFFPRQTQTAEKHILKKEERSRIFREKTGKKAGLTGSQSYLPEFSAGKQIQPGGALLQEQFSCKIVTYAKMLRTVAVPGQDERHPVFAENMQKCRRRVGIFLSGSGHDPGIDFKKQVGPFL